MVTRIPLRRSSTDSIVGGVCGGLSRYLGIDAWLIRIGVIALTCLTGFGVPLYIGAWLLLPRDNQRQSIVQRTFDKSAISYQGAPATGRRLRPRTAAALIGAVLGLSAVASIIAVSQAGFWPLFPIAIVGCVLISRRSARRQPNQRRPQGLPSSDQFQGALSAWQQRLDAQQQQAQATPSGYTMLPDSILSAAEIKPPSGGFTPAVSSLDLGDPWPASPASAASGYSGPSAPSGYTPSTPSGYTPSAPSGYTPSVGYTPSTGNPDIGQVPVAGPAGSFPGAGLPPQPSPAFQSSPAAFSAYASPVLGYATPGDTSASATIGPWTTPAAPLAVESFFAHAAPAPDSATALAVTNRRRHPVMMGWLLVLLLAAMVSGFHLLTGQQLSNYPEVAVGGVLGVLGLGLVASPWTGRPKWLVPVAALVLVASVGLAFLFALFGRW